MHRGANKKYGAFHWTRILFSLISIKLTFPVFGKSLILVHLQKAKNLSQPDFLSTGFTRGYA